MIRSSRLRTRTYRYLSLGVAVLISSLTYSLTASNSVPGTKIGVGSGAIRRFNPSNFDFMVDVSNPQTIASVSFILARAALPSTVIKIEVSDGSATWYPCSVTGSPAINVTCNTPGSVTVTGTATIVAAD